MKIRCITYFLNPKYPLDENALRKAGEFLSTAKAAYAAAGYETQMLRLATIPFPKLLNGDVKKLPQLAQEFGKLLPQIGADYVSLGPALIEFPESYEVIHEALVASENTFFSGVIADKQNGISMQAIHACARIIQQASTILPNGFANLRFAALANVKAGSPFFPAAYHDSETPAFAIATESADLAVQAFSNIKTLEEGRQNLIASITQHGQALALISNSLLSDSINFRGIDFSLAPFPDNEHSLGGAVEKMGIPKIGLHGSLAAAAILTEAIDRADFPHTGFSGFMQPILEDSILAQRAAAGTLSIKDALLYSAVCGTGLDTIALPGDTTSEQIAPLLLDLSALSLRLDKPLTARLMPIPNKKTGDDTNFDFAFFASSKILKLESEPLTAPFAQEKSFHLQSRQQG